MTTCIRNTKEVTKTITETVNDGYTLHLTDAQAETLLVVCHRVGGYPKGRRGAMDGIARALREAGLKAPMTHDGYFIGQGNITL